MNDGHGTTYGSGLNGRSVGALREREPARPLRPDAAEAFVASTAFTTGTPHRLGLELEWLVHDVAQPASPVSGERLDAALATVDGLAASSVTVEPGGQVELSVSPQSGLTRCLEVTGRDLTVLRNALSAHALALTGDGLDPYRPPRRVVDLPRYAAMERFFDREGPYGRMMMCSTASLQVCVDAGEEASVSRPDLMDRWRLVHLLRPVLVAAFANSPFAGGRPTGWRCTRQVVWARMDPSRTSPVWRSTAEDPGEAWGRFAMSARVLCIRPRPEDAMPGQYHVPPASLSFGQWLRGEGPRPPTIDDLTYHLSTLFPPVRPRGYLEIRYLDAQTPAHWPVLTAVISALLDDSQAAACAAAATESLPPDITTTLRAACFGLGDRQLHRAARICFDAALGALDRIGAGNLHSAVDRYAERYVDRARCPADDRLDYWYRTGKVACGYPSHDGSALDGRQWEADDADTGYGVRGLSLPHAR